jgi:hypothetical protein
VTFGAGEKFANPRIQFDAITGLPGLRYDGTGIASVGGENGEDGGLIVVKAPQDINLGAGAAGGTIRLDAGGNINQGTGAVTAQNVQISAGGSISGTFTASGSITVGSGTVSSGASISAAGFVAGAGGSASNAGKVNADTVVSSREQGTNAAGPAGTSNLGVGAARGVVIDVSSRPCNPGECD